MFLCLLLALLFSPYMEIFFSLITDLSGGLNQLCLDWAPKSQHREVYQALVCAHPIKTHASQFLFKELGAIHILVVSGAHLYFLETLIKKVSGHHGPPWIYNLVLLLFVAICQWKAPILRAFLFMQINHINKRRALSLPHHYRLFLSVFLCLVLNPTWIQSPSLPLSWLACLGLSLGRHSFSQSFLIYLFVSPIIAPMGLPSAWSILINAFITPIIGLALFPLSLFCFLIPHLHQWVDPLWDGCLFVFDHLYQVIGEGYVKSQSPRPLTFWFYCVGIHGLIEANEIRKRWPVFSVF